MPLVPGSHFWDNVQTAWVRADLGNKLLNSIIFAATVACRQGASLIDGGLLDRLFPLSRPAC
jgi:hypothetical protein